MKPPVRVLELGASEAPLRLATSPMPRNQPPVFAGSGTPAKSCVAAEATRAGAVRRARSICLGGAGLAGKSVAFLSAQALQDLLHLNRLLQIFLGDRISFHTRRAVDALNASRPTRIA